MQQLAEDDLKQIQIEILDVVATFCKEHGIRYWIDSGTLLGSIRHKGYIPWDDDIDIGMLRPDYERFKELFNAENSRYQLICNDLDPTCIYPFAKVLDTQTVLYEPDEEHGVQTCINIDIFIYDNAPDDDAECKRMYDARDRYVMLNLLQNRLIGTHSLSKDIVKFVGYHVLRHFPVACFATKVVENAKSYDVVETGYVGNFTAVSRIKVSKHVFDSFITGEFEGKYYNIPVGYDEWLTAFYGDYMQLPPAEKRVAHHMYVAYKL